MSTGNIRKALEFVDTGHPNAPGNLEWVLKAAMNDVSAIEKVAKEACAGSVTHRLMSSDEGVELGMLLESIAKDSK